MNIDLKVRSVVGWAGVALLIAACTPAPTANPSTATPLPAPTALVEHASTSTPLSTPASPEAEVPPAPQAAATPSPVPSPRTPVLVDTDMSMDAVMAILYILQRPELSVRAITVVGTGEAHCGPGTAHALGLVAIAGARDIPVACGRETPLVGDHQFPRRWRQRVDEGPGITWPEAGKPSSLSAPELLRKAIQEASQPVVVVTDGPLTNLAEMFQLDPQLAAKIKMIYVMGGAIDVRGNVCCTLLSAPNEKAEFNIFVDPRAAHVVLASGAPVTLVPLDATNQVPLDRTFYKLLSQHRDTAAAEAVYAMLAETRAYQEGSSLWDPLTYAIAADETLAEYATKRIEVVEEEGSEAGRTVVSAQGNDVRVATKVDADRFVAAYLSGLNGGREVVIDWAAARAAPAGLLTITVEGGQCALESPKRLVAGEIGVRVVNKDRDRYSWVAAFNVDDDKTPAEVLAGDANKSDLAPPAWIHVLGFAFADAGKERTEQVEVGGGPLYLVCVDGPPDNRLKTFGPLEVTAAPTPVPPSAEMIDPGEQIGTMLLRTGRDESGEPDIFNHCSPEITEFDPAVIVRTCSVPQMPYIFIGYGDVAGTTDEMDALWSGEAWELHLDDQAVNVRAFGEFDSEFSGSVLRRWNVAVENMAPGEHKLRYVITKLDGSRTDATWVFKVGEASR